MKRNILLAVTAALVIGIQTPSWADKASDTLRAAVRQPIEHLDFNYRRSRDENFVHSHLFDTLIFRDPDTFEFKPLLATSWRWINPQVLELKLRQGVKFSNGAEFDARSVKASLEYGANPEAKISFQTDYNWIAGVDIKDPYTVQVRSKTLFPGVIENLAMVNPIYHFSFFEGRPFGPSSAIIGTGPYRVARFDPGRLIVLEKNPDYFSDVRGKPRIGRIEIRVVPDDATQIAELLSRRMDWMWYVPSDQMERLGAVPGLEVVRAETMRIAYLIMDAAGRTGHKAIKDVRVRRAIAHAIDREKIRAHLVGGNTRVIDAPCYPSQVGCEAGDVVKYKYDPTLARNLLAEAGYPNGFGIDMVGFRFKAWSEAVMGDLAKIGITVKLHQVPYSSAVSMLQKEQVQLAFLDWGSGSLNDVAAILPQHFTGGVDDFLRDAEVTALVQEGGSTLDLEKRKAVYHKAIHIITNKVAWLPMFTVSANYAWTKELNCKAYADEYPRLNRCKWN